MRSRLATLAPLLTFVALAVVYHFSIGPFFPNRGGGLGHDYSMMLPLLLAGRYWFEVNGLTAIPWFTPAFCGGQPLLADPQSFYYSVPQLLALFMDPLLAVKATLMLFAAAGFWGFYRLVRIDFRASQAAALLAGALFMFNGFFSSRMIVGHMTFHAFMLVPWAAHALLYLPPNPGRRLPDLRQGVLAGLCGAYGFYSGMVHLLVPVGLAITLLLCVDRLREPQLPLHKLALRCAVALVVTAGLSALKLEASLAYLSAFQRTDYLLPGIGSLWHEIVVLFEALFLAPPNIDHEVAGLLRNAQWRLARHEWEFGVGIVPLILLLWWMLAPRLPRTDKLYWSGRHAALLIAGLILAAPLALNAYSPGWNALLKQLPLLKSSSNLFRWWIIYIPVLCLTPLVLEKLAAAQRTRAVAVALSLLALGSLTADRASYQQENYRPDAVLAGHQRLLAMRQPPPITGVRYPLVDPQGQVRGVSPFPNDPLVEGLSPLACYNPMFGYQLEHFPLGSLREGAVYELGDGVFNFKNPACYTYPRENSCRPGDHFREQDRAALASFVEYKPYPFRLSARQRLANGISLIATLACAAILCIGYARKRPGG